MKKRMFIDMDGTTARFHDEPMILKNVNISFEHGKIHGLIGRNGSGKTMLMKCICGFIKPSEGEIIVNGKRVGKDCDFPENIGIIIETPGFIPYYSGYKNLKLLAGLNGKISSSEIKESMKLVGLDPELKRHVRKYSLGMRQRLGLAQAIMENPEILILDEPMNGLDKDGVNDTYTYLIKNNITIMDNYISSSIKYVGEYLNTVKDNFVAAGEQIKLCYNYTVSMFKTCLGTITDLNNLITEYKVKLAYVLIDLVPEIAENIKESFSTISNHVEYAVDFWNNEWKELKSKGVVDYLYDNANEIKTDIEKIFCSDNQMLLPLKNNTQEIPYMLLKLRVKKLLFSKRNLKLNKPI